MLATTIASLDNAARAIIIGFYFEVTRRIAEKIHINIVSVKPQLELFEKALQALGIEKSRVIMVGDAFETDIASANNFGIDSLLIAGGIHQAELTPLCTETVKTLANRYKFTPSYFCQSFSW